MSPRKVLRALAEPFTRAAVLLAALLFWLLAAAALLALQLLGSFAPLLGLLGAGFIAAIGVPALARYVLVLVAARAEERALPAPDTDLFLPSSSLRPLAALPVLATLTWLSGLSLSAWPVAGWVCVALLGGVLAPLHLVMLALTNSPLDSVHPLKLLRLAQRLWPAGCWQPLVTLLLAWIAVPLLRQVSPLVAPGVVLAMLLPLATLAGALAATLDVRAETDIPVPREPGAAEQDAALVAARRRVLAHAYGLASRGNRDGAFAHIAQHCRGTNDPLGAELWFFHAMRRWDLGDTPLFFGQALIGHLLDAGDAQAACKVMTACLHGNERFRPRPEDCGRLKEAAEAAGRRDIVAALAR